MVFVARVRGVVALALFGPSPRLWWLDGDAYALWSRARNGRGWFDSTRVFFIRILLCAAVFSGCASSRDAEGAP